MALKLVSLYRGSTVPRPLASVDPDRAWVYLSKSPSMYVCTIAPLHRCTAASPVTDAAADAAPRTNRPDMSAAASLRASTKYPQSPQSGATALVLVPAARNIHWHPGKQRGLPRGIFKAEKSPPRPSQSGPVKRCTRYYDICTCTAGYRITAAL
jgi:hypothetical protein